MSPSTTSYVLGLNKYDHDVSACLLRDGVPVAAIAKERLTREKNAGGLPDVAVGYCLRAAGVRFGSVDLVVQNSYALNVPAMEQDLLSRPHALHLPSDERDLAFASPLFRNPDAVTISHHLAHAWSAFAPSPVTDGAVMVIDGVGNHRADVSERLPAGDSGQLTDREAESYYVFDDRTLTCVGKQWLRATPSPLLEDFSKLGGLGAVYSRVSDYVFGHWNRCGEVMGLAAFGRARDDIPQLMGVGAAETWALERWPDALRNPWIEPDGPQLSATDVRRAWETSPHQQEWRDLCWRVQDDLETALVERARRLHAITGKSRLVAAGGVLLNCVANTRLLEETPFEEIWIQPAAGDQGISLGCALHGDIAVRGAPRRYRMGTDGLGVSYDPVTDIDRALDTPAFAPFLRVRVADDVAVETAALLADGAVVGWFQGGAELGPRALGQRSILCDPRDPAAKERLNARVKHRQAFRPFAPAVLAEAADAWFEPGPESTHMLFTRRVREDRRDRIPAVVHVDGTARLQTVVAEQRPELHALITEFDRLTGVPIVVNTSFNVKGEPIVETPFDALVCFLGTDMDVLVLHDRIVHKRALAGPLRRLLFWLHRRTAPKQDPAFTGS